MFLLIFLGYAISHRNVRSGQDNINLLFTDDLTHSDLLAKPGLDISPAGIARAKAYDARQAGKDTYARAMGRLGLIPTKKSWPEELMERAGTITAIRDTVVYPVEHPVEFVKGAIKLGAVYPLIYTPIVIKQQVWLAAQASH